MDSWIRGSLKGGPERKEGFEKTKNEAWQSSVKSQPARSFWMLIVEPQIRISNSGDYYADGEIIDPDNFRIEQALAWKLNARSAGSSLLII